MVLVGGGFESSAALLWGVRASQAELMWTRAIIGNKQDSEWV